MKKAFFLFVFLTMLTDTVNAQIQSFWGLKLGMTKNQVESTLNTYGKKWKVLDNGKIFVYKPTFNGIEFTILKLTFKTNKLESGIFEMVLQEFVWVDVGAGASSPRTAGRYAAKAQLWGLGSPHS